MLSSGSSCAGCKCKYTVAPSKRPRPARGLLAIQWKYGVLPADHLGVTNSSNSSIRPRRMSRTLRMKAQEVNCTPGIDASREAAEARMSTSVANMADHYRDSVQMIAEVKPGSAFLSALRLELDRLDSVAA